jgi:hypothetical protein
VKFTHMVLGLSVCTTALFSACWIAPANNTPPLKEVLPFIYFLSGGFVAYWDTPSNPAIPIPTTSSKDFSVSLVTSISNDIDSNTRIKPGLDEYSLRTESVANCLELKLIPPTVVQLGYEAQAILTSKDCAAGDYVIKVFAQRTAGDLITSNMRIRIGN